MAVAAAGTAGAPLSMSRDAATDAATIAAAVQALVQARRSGQRTPAAAVVLPDADAAYAVQDGVAAALGWYEPGSAGTWKVGVARGDVSRTHARLPDAGVWRSPASAGGWPLHQRGIEAEIAFRLARDLSPDEALALDEWAAVALVDAMCVTIEVVDSRWSEGTAAPAMHALADLQSHGALVLAEWVPMQLRDWAQQECVVTIGAAPALTRRGSHPLVDPARLVVDWLRHAARGGQVVPTGSVVTTGSWVGILEVERGDRVHVRFPGIGQAELQL
jgi:2-keto-4-pentenoate hydratase